MQLALSAVSGQTPPGLGGSCIEPGSRCSVCGRQLVQWTRPMPCQDRIQGMLSELQGHNLWVESHIGRHLHCVCGEVISAKGCTHSCVEKNVFPLPRWPGVSLCLQACLQAAGHAICGVLCGLYVGTRHSGSGTSSHFLLLSQTLPSTTFCHHLWGSCDLRL